MEASELVGVILAGGRSSRMGRPKEEILLDGEPLLQRQQRLLHAVGIRRVLLSMGKPQERAPGKLLQGMTGEVVYDAHEGGGPLVGIVACLRRVTRRPPDELWASAILVMAVDMPRLHAGLMKELVETWEPGRGVAPRVGGRWEPLVAVYPREALGPASRLVEGDLPSSPSALLDQLEARGQVRATEVRPEWLAGLRSWNTPDDLPGSRGPRN